MSTEAWCAEGTLVCPHSWSGKPVPMGHSSHQADSLVLSTSPLRPPQERWEQLGGGS